MATSGFAIQTYGGRPAHCYNIIMFVKKKMNYCRYEKQKKKETTLRFTLDKSK